MVYCPKCGTKNNDGDSYCRECGMQLGSSPQSDEEFTYVDALKDFLYIKEGSTERISKAKLIGLVVLVIYLIMGMNMARGSYGLFMFSTTMFIFYCIGLLYYFLIRGLGYILREFVMGRVNQ